MAKKILGFTIINLIFNVALNLIFGGVTALSMGFDYFLPEINYSLSVVFPLGALITLFVFLFYYFIVPLIFKNIDKLYIRRFLSLSFVVILVISLAFALVECNIDPLVPRNWATLLFSNSSNSLALIIYAYIDSNGFSKAFLSLIPIMLILENVIKIVFVNLGLDRLKKGCGA